MKKPTLVEALVLALGLVSSCQSFAQTTWLPPSRHQRLLTYALFTEEHSSLLIRDAGRAWGAIGGSIALLELPAAPGRPQLIFHGSANSSFRLNPNYLGLLTETIDARVGLAAEFELSPRLRFSAGWTHFSGHTSDDIPDRELIGPNLGQEYLPLRLVYDWLSRVRVGGTLKPIFGSDPGVKFFAADQFVEWFPCGSFEENRAPTPFVAFGLEQWGPHRIELSTHAQLGAYLGGHLAEVRTPAARLVVGYYSGLDPSLKYAVFRDSRVQFVYAGAMFDL